MTLAEFLLARIAEDEVVAQELKDHRPASGHSDAAWTVALLREPLQTFVLRNSPNRVLAECEAKRRIVEEHRCTRGTPEIPRCSACSAPGSITGKLWPCQTIRALALPYADHPDYREEWRP